LEVKVKFVDIQRGSDGEGSNLTKTDAEKQKHGDRRGLDTRLVHALTYECSVKPKWIHMQLTRKHSA
jgi:hypothetical protein